MKKVIIVFRPSGNPHSYNFVKVFATEDALFKYGMKARPDSRNLRLKKDTNGQYSLLNHNSHIFPWHIILEVPVRE